MKAYYLLFSVLSLLITIYFKPENNSSFDSSFNFYFSLIAFFNIIIFWRYLMKTNSLISFGVLFTLGYFIVHFQIPFLASIGVDPVKPKLIWVNKWVVNYATWISLICLQLWILGYLLYNNTSKAKTSDRYFINITKLNFLLVVLFLSFLFFVGSDFLSGNYKGSSNWNSISVYIFILLRVVICLKVYYFFYQNRKVSLISILENKIFFSILFIYILIFLNAGDRGPLIDLIIVFLFSFSLYNDQISFSKFILGFVFIAFSLNIIKQGRTNDVSGRETNIVVSGYNNFTNDGIFNPTDELASSNRILYIALDKVPDKHPYLFGLTFVNEIIGCIPFGMFVYTKFIDLPESYISTSRFFTIIRQGKFYGSGDGSEILADIYVNFGLHGLLIIMFLFGFLVSLIHDKALGSGVDTYKISYVFLVISAIYMNRSCLFEPLKIIIYALVIDYLFVKKVGYGE